MLVRTLVLDTPFALKGARLRGLERADARLGLARLRAGRRRGELLLAPARALFPFDDLVLSVNAAVPRGARLELQARTGRGAAWGSWRVLGVLEGGAGASAPGQPEVDVEPLRLRRPARRFQLRVLFSGKGPGPVLKLLAAAYAGPGRAARRPPGEGSVLLDVAPRSQRVEEPALRDRVCSPASLGMALGYWGAAPSTSRIAAAVRDRSSGLYGNWLLNTAWAGRGRRLDSCVARLGDLRDLELELRRGRPVVCSLAFEKGELSGAPLPRTDGHLVLVRGLDRRGNVIVNDPAAPTAAEAPRVYRRAQFERAWLDRKGGLSYLLRPRLPGLFAVAEPAVELRRRPGRGGGRRDRGLESQLLLGERVRVRALRGGWARVEALEQPWKGGAYEGWTPFEGLVRCEEAPDRVLREARGGLPAGALVRDLGASRGARRASGAAGSPELRGGGRRVLLPGDRVRLLPAAALRPLAPLPAGRARRLALGWAAGRLGVPYCWGGLAPAPAGRGLDCSGLVHVACRVAGLRVPRNAEDQRAEAAPVERPRPGDLLFLSKGGRADHVMLWAGGGRLLEAEGAADRVRLVRCEEKLGAPAARLRAGGVYKGKTLSFGTYFVEPPP